MERSALVLGAGPAGLACAAALRKQGITARILERGPALAMSWRRHYTRLHLHTDKGHSALPGLAMPRAYPRYPSRDQVIAYLERYAEAHGLTPEYGCDVQSLTFDGIWRASTSQGPREAEIAVVALGMAAFPHSPDWPGLPSFPGPVRHSSGYTDPSAFTDQRVLVVGLGNSGGEIALDLAEAGVDVSLCVRGPVTVIPKELLGIPILTLAIAQKNMPLALADRLNRLISRLVFGDLTRLGLQVSDLGPLRQVREKRKIPLIDIGTIAAIRDGRITVLPGIEGFDGNAIRFHDGQTRAFDALILATGFRPDLRPLLPGHVDLLDASGAPRISGAESGRDHLYFCSYLPSPTGQLREIGLEAEAIARAAAA